MAVLCISPINLLCIILLLLSMMNHQICADRTCGGLHYDPVTQESEYKCTESPSAPGIHRCPNDRYGCSEYTTNGVTEWWCCGEFCDEGRTQQPLNLRTAEKCVENAGVFTCPTNSNTNRMACKEIKSLQEQFCCPINPTSPVPPTPNRGVIGGDCDDHRTDCEAKADYCILEFAYERMYRDCPKTCNRCGTGECEDMGTDCADRKRDGYCERAVYRDLMDWQCPKSCDRCSVRDQRMPRGQMRMSRL